jgi:myo-inositol 2-dehydrogenase/D-chiro-inositol 1-dehydrogenase
MVGIGIIGTGKQGTDHAKRIAALADKARVVTLHDALAGRAHSLAKEIGSEVAADDQAVIDHPDVDAVIVAAPSETHPEFSLACIAAGKPALCEKPLATTVDGCVRIMDAEIAAGRRLIQVGFMRRFDAQYARVKQAIDDGSIGDPLVMHCVHRNQAVPAGFRTTQTLTDSVIHEIDCTRWLLAEEIVMVSVDKPRRSINASEQLADPLMVRLETASGTVVDVEAFVTARYGYDVRCEVVGSGGYAALEPLPLPLVTLESAPAQGISPDWLTRFSQAYDAEITTWLDDLGSDRPAPDAWDGYAATVVAAACVRALRSGQPEAVSLGPRPSLYT